MKSVITTAILQIIIIIIIIAALFFVGALFFFSHLIIQLPPPYFFLLPLCFIVTALSFCRHLIGEGNIKRRHSNNKAATKNMEWLCMALLGFLTSVLQPLFDKVAGLQDCNFIKKKASRQVFSCEYCAIFKISFLIEHLRWLLLNSMKLGFI